MAKRMVTGIQVQTETLATAMFEGIDFKGDFLKQKITRQLFPKEQYLPSAVIDRDSIRGWQEAGSLDTFARAKQRTRELLEAYRRPDIEPQKEKAMNEMVQHLAQKAGMAHIPPLE